MKKRYSILFIILIYFNNYTMGQVNCVYCFDQNVPVSSPVNNLIQNGGFETGNCSPGYVLDFLCPASSNYSCDIDNWTCTGGGTGTYACVLANDINSRSFVPEGLQALYLGNSFASVCNGTYQQSFSNSLSINIKNIASGMYIYEVKDKNKIIKTGKIIKD